MAKSLYRLVNRGLAGEPEDIVLQQVGSVHIIELDNIPKVLEINCGIREWDSSLDKKRMFQKDGHEFYIHTINGETILEL